MCLVTSSSNGTVTGLTSGTSARAGAESNRKQRERARKRFISKALPGLDRDLQVLGIAKHSQLHALTRRHLGGKLVQLGGGFHILALEFANAVADFQFRG